MPLRYRKSVKLGPARINVSNRGVGGSIGAGGVRYSTASRRRRAKSSCCLNLILTLPFHLSVALIRRAVVSVQRPLR